MRYTLNIHRQKRGEHTGTFRTYDFETDDAAMTLAAALNELNLRNPADPIAWEHGCYQKKCGACAMVVNGRPRLACDTVLAKVARRGRITVEPLRKFPVIEDLLVDRSVMFENLKTMELWALSQIAPNERQLDSTYEASRCLQCGCCLEVCPNFYVGGRLFGTAAMVSASRILPLQDKAESAELRTSYMKHIYEPCGKSLACRDICPAHIDIESLLVRSNAVSLWKKSGA